MGTPKTLDVRELRSFVHTPTEILKIMEDFESGFPSSGHLDWLSRMY